MLRRAARIGRECAENVDWTDMSSRGDRTVLPSHPISPSPPDTARTCRRAWISRQQALTENVPVPVPAGSCR